MENERDMVVFDEEVQRLIDSFSYCFKVRVTIFSSGGDNLVIGYPYGLSPYCLLIRESLGMEQACLKQNSQSFIRSRKLQRPLLYHCHAGLTEAVMPILSGKNLAGYAMIGQFRMCEKPPEEIVKLCKTTAPESLEAAFSELPLFDRTTVHNMLHLFSMLVQFIVSREYVKIKRLDLAERISHWLDSRAAGSVSLAEAAEAMCYSPSTISHTVKHAFGMSFKQLHTYKRVLAFEGILKKSPVLTISEAAEQAGYDDPLYFSRIYKKLRRRTPKEFRNIVRRQMVH
ncbi:MAG: PocR ligand-binding domain-containing protein [Treponema sp.]|nr:PocR ligand-binding domain-containing protein [Treponema sp.]